MGMLKLAMSWFYDCITLTNRKLQIIHSFCQILWQIHSLPTICMSGGTSKILWKLLHDSFMIWLSIVNGFRERSSSVYKQAHTLGVWGASALLPFPKVEKKPTYPADCGDLLGKWRVFLVPKVLSAPIKIPVCLCVPIKQRANSSRRVKTCKVNLVIWENSSQ